MMRAFADSGVLQKILMFACFWLGLRHFGSFIQVAHVIDWGLSFALTLSLCRPVGSVWK